MLKMIIRIFGNGQKKYNSVEELGKDEKAFQTIVQIELATYTKLTMVDNGEFLLAKGVKNNGNMHTK
jgi:hypothetical protein